MLVFGEAADLSVHGESVCSIRNFTVPFDVSTFPDVSQQFRKITEKCTFNKEHGTTLH